MKVLIVLAAVAVASVSAKHYYGAPLAGPVALATTGTSSQFRAEDNYGNYNFGYDESHATGATSRREESNNGVRRGSYSLSDADGRRRVVNYIADATGFHATVETNEPGVEPKDPADVLINKAPVQVVAGPIAAPLPVAAPLPAPLPAPVAAAPWAPAPLPLPAPVAAPLPAPIAGPGYGLKGLVAPAFSAPRVLAAPAQPALIVEPATPRAFSYSFGASHQAPIAVPAPLPAPLPVPAPIYQQKLEY